MLSTTDIAAWVGATTGVVAVLLDLYRSVRSGPRIVVNAKAGYRLIKRGEQDDKTWVVFDVSNIGSRGTTILGVAYGVFKSRWHHIRKQPLSSGIVLSPGELTGQPLPYMLQPGSRWMGMIEQDDTLSTEIASKPCYVSINCVDGQYEARVDVYSQQGPANDNEKSDLRKSLT